MLDPSLDRQLRAWEKTRAQLGNEHLEVAVLMSAIARTYDQHGNHEKSLWYDVRALGIRERLLGKDHPDLAEDLNHIAQTHAMLGEQDKASKFKLRASSLSRTASQLTTVPAPPLPCKQPPVPPLNVRQVPLKVPSPPAVPKLPAPPNQNNVKKHGRFVKRAAFAAVIYIVVYFLWHRGFFNTDSPTDPAPEAVKPSNSETLAVPDLAGTPFEALAKAQAWLKGFEDDVAKSIASTASRIQTGATPDKELMTLEARLAHSKQIIASTNGLTALLLEQEQKMAEQGKDVEKKALQPGLDSGVKQQYADALSAAQKSLEAYRTCRANAEIMGKRTDEVSAFCKQWRTFYQTTAGITGTDAAKTKLLAMMADVRANWEKRP